MEPPPAGLFLRRQTGQRRLVAHTGKVGIALPVPEQFPHGCAGVSGRFIGLLRPQGQVGRQPVERLLAPPRQLLDVEFATVLALTGSGQRGGAGGVVTVLGLQVVGQLRLGGEGAPSVVPSKGAWVRTR